MIIFKLLFSEVWVRKIYPPERRLISTTSDIVSLFPLISFSKKILFIEYALNPKFWILNNDSNNSFYPNKFRIRLIDNFQHLHFQHDRKNKSIYSQHGRNNENCVTATFALHATIKIWNQVILTSEDGYEYRYLCDGPEGMKNFISI